MSRAALLGGVLALVVGAASAGAREVPTLRARVTDEAGVLGGRREVIERRLEQYEHETGHQLAVLVVRSLEGEVIEPWSIKVAEAWRLGDKARDDGILLVVAVDDRAARIEVGYGLEGAVPDVIAGRILRERMFPRFREGDYAAGVEDGLESLMHAARGEALGPPPRGRDVGEPGDNWLPAGVVLLGLLSGLLRLPRVVRVPIAALMGGFIGFGILESPLWALGIALGLALLALVLPTVRGGGRLGGGFIGTRSSSWSSSGVRLGGFSGGGGHFGGGGASGRW